MFSITDNADEDQMNAHVHVFFCASMVNWTADEEIHMVFTCSDGSLSSVVRAMVL